MKESPCLRIAGISFPVSHARIVRMRMLNPLYRSFMVSAGKPKEDAKIEVNLTLGQFPDLGQMKKTYATGASWSMFSDEDRFWITLHPPRREKPFWIAAFDQGVNQVDYYRELLVADDKSPAILHPICYPLDQLLLMYYFARRNGILTHSAGIVRKGKAYLFAGASGAGKSTISLLLAAAKAGKMLSDERMIVREIDGTMQAFGTPWAGTARIARDGSAPLAGIFFLKHGESNRIEKLAAGEAADRLLPMASIPWYDTGTMMPIIAFAKQVLAAVPAYEFSFSPDRAAVDLFLNFCKKTY